MIVVSSGVVIDVVVGGGRVSVLLLQLLGVHVAQPGNTRQRDVIAECIVSASVYVLVVHDLSRHCARQFIA